MHLSSLSETLLRISASLDLETVLREVMDGTRTFTGASCGCIVTFDESGATEDFLTSGMTEDEHRAMLEWPSRMGLFERFRDLPGPLRLPDFPGFVKSLGFDWDLQPIATALCTPMRHLGAHVGNFYLGDKEGGAQFTDRDQEALLLFAAQAAAAVVNARSYRAEQRARSHLEALVEISPVGVLVFDPRTGLPNLVNREARRIAEALRIPGRPAEDSLESMTCRFSDGREVVLDRSSLAATLQRAEPVRVEEVTLSAPDGRSLTTLISSTPIHAEDGTVESVVVTMQDLAPLQELDRMRAEFLGMVSHELRTPLAAIKGSTTTVLTTGQNFGPAETRQFFRIIDQQADSMSGLIGDLLDAGRIAAGTLSVAPEPSDVGELVEQARTAFLSGNGRHIVRIDLPPDLPRVMADRGRVVQVLSNLLANAARHSPESAPIRVAAVREGTHVAVSVSDEGRGVAPERLGRLFQKYSGADGAERGVGGGLGLAICKGLVEAHGGRIRAESAGPGQGACFTFTIPAAGEAGSGGGRAPGRRGSRRETPEPPRVLVVDDDPRMLRFLRDELVGAGYAPLVAGDHKDLARVLEVERPALVVLDLVLPGTDGIELMKTMPALADLPVIMISGYGRDETVAQALEAGAEDYIVKPFSPTELTARIRAALRRRADPDPFVLGDLAIDYDARRVTLGGRAVELTATEYEVLRVLSLDAGRVVTHDALLRRVWHRRGKMKANPKLLHAYVKRLRRKLADDRARSAHIVTERGVGYRMPRPGEDD